MRINHNLASINSYGQLTKNNAATSKSLEKLSSGLRINRAGDDAAGLAISEKMRSQISGLAQAQRNAQDGISMIQTAEGALTETHSILQRMRELSVQGASDTLNTSDRSAISTEIGQLSNEIDRIANSTQFNGRSLLSGNMALSVTTNIVAATSISIDISKIATTATLAFTVNTANMTVRLADGASAFSEVVSITGSAATNVSLNFSGLGVKVNISNFSAGIAAIDAKTLAASGSAAVTLQIGANTNQNYDTLTIGIDKMDAGTLAVNSLQVDTNTNARAAIDNIDTAIKNVSTQRAKLGAYQNRLEHTINNLSAAEENLTASESRIRDTDMAKEMMDFTKNNILNQAATAMLAQANQQPQGVLQLLR